MTVPTTVLQVNLLESTDHLSSTPVQKAPDIGSGGGIWRNDYR